MKTAVIIGSGIGGLASAIRLQVKGYQVTVLEKNDYPGGKLTEIGNEKYRFDAGPSLFTLPEKVNELLALGEHNTKDFKYEKLEEICRYFYDDQSIVHGWADSKKFSGEVKNKFGVDSQIVQKYLQKSAFLYNSTSHLFLDSSLHKIKSYLKWKTLISFLQLPFMNTNVSMNAVNEKVLQNDKLVQLFNRYATYNGSNPYKAPGILNMIPHLEFGRGAYFPVGGMHKITEALFEKAKQLNVQFKFGQNVVKAHLKNKNINSIECDNGKKYRGDIVISNMDVYPFYKHVLSQIKSPEKILSQERSSSALIFYWGIKKSFDDLILHNIFFSNNYKEEFHKIFEEATIYEDPTVYVNISSKHHFPDAPEGCENWFVMINVPGNKGQNWDKLISQSRQNIINKLSRILKTDIESLIEFEDHLDPRLIELRTASYQGSLYGTSSNTKMAAFFRHPNFSKKVKNLYFCGGSVHPGGGIPLALSSAKIVSELV